MWQQLDERYNLTSPKSLRSHHFQFQNRVKNYPADLTHHNPHAEMPKPKSELKLEIRNPEPPKRNQPLNVRDLETRNSQPDKSQGATTPKTISTALSNRHPAEDTTLDFSYDNMGMNETPPEQGGLSSHRFWGQVYFGGITVKYIEVGS